MRNKLLALYRKHGELLRYLIIGGVTTGIDLVSFALLHPLLGIDAAKVAAWVLAVSFSFAGSKWVVFRTGATDRRGLLLEAARFFAMRGVTLLIALLFNRLTINGLSWDENIANLVANVIVVILNYIFSKLFVFVKRT